MKYCLHVYIKGNVVPVRYILNDSNLPALVACIIREKEVMLAELMSVEEEHICYYDECFDTISEITYARLLVRFKAASILLN